MSRYNPLIKLNQCYGGVTGFDLVNGSGKIKFEDTLWDVDGADMAVGARVKVTGVQGMRLVVEAG